MCAEHSPCSGRAARGLALSPGRGAPFPSTASGPGSQGLVCTLPQARCAFYPCSERLRPPEAWVPFPWVRRAFSFHGPRVHRRSGLRKSLDRNRGLFAGWEGVASLGLSLPLSPPPASFLQQGWGGSSLEFLSPFVVRTAGGVFRLVNFSLALPQFKKISLRLLSGPSGRSLP